MARSGRHNTKTPTWWEVWTKISEPRHKKPSMRGMMHAVSFFVALVAVIVLDLHAPAGFPRQACLVYGLSLLAVLGTSALYHRVYWPDKLHLIVKRLDHCMIFFLIAGTYTPIAMLSLRNNIGQMLLYAIWIAAAAGVLVKLLWISGK